MSTALSNAASTHTDTSTPLTSRRKLLIAAGLLALLLVALLMRLYTLGVPFDRDSYDEGVYWQTLRSLGAGYALYHPTFYSQPPMFLFSIFPIYLLFGQTLWSARLGIALISLTGLVGIFLLGYALRKWIGAFTALILLMLTPLYLSASQTIQAEGPQVAFSILAVAFAYLWWQKPTGWRGGLLAALCTFTLMLSIFSKLFALATFVPVALLALAQIWRITRQPVEMRWQNARSLVIGIGVGILTALVLMLPFLGSLADFWSGVVSFHNAAKTATPHVSNTNKIVYFLLAPLGFAALYGSIVALLKKDWRVLPLLAWALVSAIMLWLQQPLFDHHLVILVPVLVALTIMGFTGLPLNKKAVMQPSGWISAGCLLLVLITLVFGARTIQLNYHKLQNQASSAATKGSQRTAHDLEQAIPADAFVITDGQFVAGLAGRNTPPELVDTSSVRINTNYLTSQQLIQQASQPKVKAILFYTGRLTNPRLQEFRSWIPQHFHQIQKYGKDGSLWVRI
ncbi:hypothetical protein KDW_15650 [Dictyobacter vulcani]|uniref:Glycosyltransferase RgtA/B/C/D-like domain-containing protein n=1 Tax=Dictyobacter vulcani TaxID=2607529 RepID=A0A5J4KI41_9CHLR|nr:glycosyltransferase family 39 protein [Dictyobacter vulcani]GER87403.1 hypothetical protein KDW_15650 [Dictyobacter vulcani]